MKTLQLTNTQSALLTKWKEVTDILDNLKTKELELRKKLVDDIFDSLRVEGTETIEIGNGYKLKANKIIYYRADNREAVLKLMALLPKELGAELFRWKAEVCISAFRNALPVFVGNNYSRELEEAIIAAITTKPGVPQLDLIIPEEK